MTDDAVRRKAILARREQRRRIPLVPPTAAVQEAFVRAQKLSRAAGNLTGRNYYHEDHRLYKVRSLLTRHSGRPVRVIGSVGGDGKIRDLWGQPFKVFVPSAAAAREEGGAA